MMVCGGAGRGRAAWRGGRLGLLLVPPALFWLAVFAALASAPGLLTDLAAFLYALMWAVFAAFVGREVAARRGAGGRAQALRGRGSPAGKGARRGGGW